MLIVAPRTACRLFPPADEGSVTWADWAPRAHCATILRLAAERLSRSHHLREVLPMVHSMTAFARVERAGSQGTLVWELRSVNHRYLEPHLRLPDALRDLEGAVREGLRQGLSRGKVECTLRLHEDSNGKPLKVDRERA